MTSAQPVNIDIVILSYARDEGLKELTDQTISTLIASEDPGRINFNIIVIESNKLLAPYQFNHSVTLYPSAKFGFNRYLNIGIKATSNPYICLCNNDLKFHSGWASEMVKAMELDISISSASAYCPDTHKKSGFEANVEPLEGYENLFSGWCFMIRRQIVQQIGFFDENFLFWYADIDYLETLKKNNLKNKLISTSFVTHLNAVTSKKLNKKEYYKLTLLPLLYLNYKSSRNNYLIYKLKTIYFYLKITFNFIR